LPTTVVSRNLRRVELAPVAVITILVAFAGPVGIVLGWWLGRRGERERQQRDERKSAYVAFVHALIRYRNATDEERRRIREDRWAALAEIVLVAPPDVVAAASYQVATGERLLDPGLAPDARQAVYMEMWERNRAFTRLARTDLRVGAADPWEAVAPVVGERIDFRPAPDGDADP
jgi:hypothetical protein